MLHESKIASPNLGNNKCSQNLNNRPSNNRHLKIWVVHYSSHGDHISWPDYKKQPYNRQVPVRGIPKCLLFKSLIKSEGSFINVVTHFYFSLSSAPFPLYHTPMPFALCTFYKMTRPCVTSFMNVPEGYYNYLKVCLFLEASSKWHSVWDLRPDKEKKKKRKQKHQKLAQVIFACYQINVVESWTEHDYWIFIFLAIS